jgi:hypothetical protein
MANSGKKLSVKQALSRLDPNRAMGGDCNAGPNDKPALARFHGTLSQALESLEGEIGKRKASAIVRHHIRTLHKAVN